MVQDCRDGHKDTKSEKTCRLNKINIKLTENIKKSNETNSRLNKENILFVEHNSDNTPDKEISVDQNQMNVETPEKKNLMTDEDALKAMEITKMKLSPNKNGDPKNTQKKNEIAKIPFEYDVFDEYSEARIIKILSAKNYITNNELERAWCILCDWVIDNSKILQHTDGQHHQAILKLHTNRIEKLKIKNKSYHVAEENTTNDMNIKLLNSLLRFQKNYVNINFESRTAACKKCIVCIEYDHEAIENHILQHNKKFKEISKTIQIEINKNTEGNKSFYTTPTVTQKEELDNAIKKWIHTDDASKIVKELYSISKVGREYPTNPKELQPKEYHLEKIPTTDYIKSALVVNNVIFEDIIINNNICINYHSLSFMYQLLDRVHVQCYACDKKVCITELERHYNTLKHDMLLTEIPVIVTTEEFIREMKPGCFHCGFCNSFETSWEDMKSHLKTLCHKDCRYNASRRLLRYKPIITSTMT